jgi:hypothetical protein
MCVDASFMTAAIIWTAESAISMSVICISESKTSVGGVGLVILG